jgi:quinol monooxygenase YgiN
MSKVLFSIQYEINPEKRAEFFRVIKELKYLMKAEGLLSYELYEVKGKTNNFQEQYSFSSLEAYEAFDDNNDERINILINKVNDMSVDRSTKYTTLIEIPEE